MSEIHDYLRELINAGKRSDPLVFAGRGAEIDKVLGTANRLPPNGPASCTILVMGAPGSGKTSLLSHLEKKLNSVDDAGALLCRDVPGDDEVERVYGKIASYIVGAAPPIMRGDTQTSYKGGVNLGVLKGEGTTFERLSLPTFHSAAAIADAKTGEWGPKKRLVVFVDEVQSIEPGSRAARMLRNLHTQAEIPVLLVCAGLSNSEIALGAAGLSRMDNNVHLGVLAERETRSCARESIEMVCSRGVAGSEAAAKRWAEALAQASDNWPRHLQMYLHAAWHALVEQDAPNLDHADLEAVLRVGNVDRGRYYETRIAAANTPLEVVVTLHRRLRDGGVLGREEAEDIIGGVIDGMGGRRRNQWAARFDDDTGRCFAELLRAGVISQNEDNRCESPVPSLSDYVLGAQSGALSQGVSDAG